MNPVTYESGDRVRLVKAFKIGIEVIDAGRVGVVHRISNVTGDPVVEWDKDLATSTPTDFIEPELLWRPAK